jgi:hypothetical protein
MTAIPNSEASQLTEQKAAAKVTPAEFGRSVCGGIMGVDLACLLTILGASFEGPLVTRAVYLFAASLALLAPHAFVSHAEAWDRHAVSRVMKWLPVFGIIFSCLGVCHLVESKFDGAGWFLGIFAAMNWWVYGQAEERMAKRLKVK